jgi:hypothetical protein
LVADVQPGVADADLDIGDGFDLDVAEAPPEAEVDPVTALREEVTELKQVVSELSDLRGLRRRDIESVLNQVGAVQRDFANFRQGDPIAALDPRISENEDLLSVMANALASSDFLEDSSKQGLRQVVQKMEANKNARNADKLRRDVVKEVQEARGEIAQARPAPSPQQQMQYQVAQATQRLMDFADGKNVPWNGIPSDELAFKPGETLPQAMNRVRKVITDLAGETASTERTANRRRAAGSGAPASAGTGAFRTQTAIRTAHASGAINTAQAKELLAAAERDNLPFQ